MSTLSWHYREDIEWPLNPDGLAKLKAEGIEHDPTVYDPAVHLIDPATVAMPEDDETLFAEMHATMERTVEARLWPRAGTSIALEPTEIAQANGVKTPKDLAFAVQKDGPLLHPAHAMQYVIDKGCKPRPGLFEDTGSVNFRNGPLVCGAVFGALPYLISDHCFAVKWYHGLIRPAQLLALWIEDSDIAPAWFTDAADELFSKLRLTRKHNRDPAKLAAEFFLYANPNHPARIAMHAALARLVKTLQVLFDLTEHDAVVLALNMFEQEITHGRDTGGVHYWDDGKEGLRVTDQVLRVVLPQEIARRGGDIEYATEITEQVLAA